ncbi:MAG: hypothetical protein PHC69_01770 [Ruminiclostridium sp.]|nr:hypothetical protein [Ruminiclostridium sp.]
MKINMSKENSVSFLAMIIMITAMYTSHWSTLIGWAIGISLVSTLLDRNGVISMINNKKRKILLGIGVTITCVSLIGEVSLLCVIMFSLGFNLTVWLIENSNSKQEDFTLNSKDKSHLNRERMKNQGFVKYFLTAFFKFLFFIGFATLLRYLIGKQQITTNDIIGGFLACIILPLTNWLVNIIRFRKDTRESI